MFYKSCIVSAFSSRFPFGLSFQRGAVVCERIGMISGHVVHEQAKGIIAAKERFR